MHSTATLDKTAKIITVIMLLVLVGLLYPVLKEGKTGGSIFTAVIDSLLFFLTVYSYYFSTSGYQIANGKLIIERPVGKKVISLKDLKAVYSFPKTEKGLTIRTLGNAGLFGYFGYFHNDKIGRFKMYSAKGWDFHILEFGKEKIGISPDDPEFIEALKGHISTSEEPQS